MIKGRGLTDKDYSEGRKVALIDKTTAASLFDNADVIGRTIEIKGEPFVVVGMVAKKADLVNGKVPLSQLPVNNWIDVE